MISIPLTAAEGGAICQSTMILLADSALVITALGGSGAVERNGYSNLQYQSKGYMLPFKVMVVALLIGPGISLKACTVIVYSIPATRPSMVTVGWVDVITSEDESFS